MKVSVIIPSYNHAWFLPTAIQSVLLQSYTDLELILVDDCSSDDSVAIARNFSDPRLRVHRNEHNIGAYATENVGLDLATGDLMAVLNSDDFWHPKKLARQIELLKKHPEASFSYTLGQVVNEDDEPLGEQDHHDGYPTDELQDVAPHLFEVNRVLASSVLFRRGAIRLEPSLRYSGDWVAALQLARKGPAAFANEPLTCWRHHPSNASRDLERTVPEEIRVRKAILSAKWPESEETRAGLARCARRLGDLYVLVGDMRAARQAYSLAGDSTASKRRLGTYLPGSISQGRIWPGTDPAPFKREYPNYDLAPLSLG